MSEASAPLIRAREELRAAHALLESGFPSQALSRAYFAGFHAASAVLLVAGETPALHAGVVAAFSRRAVQRGGIDQPVARSLRKLLEDRDDVDYGLTEAPPREAQAAIESARQVVEAAATWIERREARHDPSRGAAGT